MNHRETDKEAELGGMGLYTDGDSYGGGGIQGDRGLHTDKYTVSQQLGTSY